MKWINILLVFKDVDGIVVIYGFDMMEEMVYFLNLVVKSDKFVVVVGLMRLVIVISVDGLLNLYNVVKIVFIKDVWNIGVLVVFNDWIGVVCYIIKIYIMVVDMFKFFE